MDFPVYKTEISIDRSLARRGAATLPIPRFGEKEQMTNLPEEKQNAIQALRLVWEKYKIAKNLWNREENVLIHELDKDYF